MNELLLLQKKYKEKADEHGYLSLFGPKEDRKYHEAKERIADRFLVAITKKILRGGNHG